jgi:hypothetical protein
MEVRPLRNDEEIMEFMKKNFGSYEAYFAQRHNEPPPPKPQVIQKNAAEISADFYQVLVKSRGLSLEQFFQRYPDE